VQSQPLLLRRLQIHVSTNHHPLTHIHTFVKGRVANISRPCKQPTFKSRDHPDANLHDSKFKWTQWRPIGLPYGNTERSALPPTTIESDDPTTEVKARDDSKATWDSRHVIGLPVARNLPATEHDPSIPDMPIEGEDDVAKIRRCKRKCRYVLDGCKVCLPSLPSRPCLMVNAVVEVDVGV
jgi:hypothetical protein